MGKVYDEITSEISQFIQEQQLFFVATAPLAAEGHPNVSPKGYDCFRILGPHEVAYIDYAGSGSETIAHIRENGRVVVMFCAFKGEPLIVRLHGRGRVLEPEDAQFKALLPKFTTDTTPRSIIHIEVQRIGDACGYAVPFFDYVGERDRLRDTWNERGPEKVRQYQINKNRQSIDGLPSLRWVESESPAESK